MALTYRTIKLAALSLLALFMLSNNSYAQIYKTTDESGNPAFSDKATDGEVIDIKTTNTVPTVTPSAPQQEPKQTDNNHYQALSISSPANESVIANGLTPFVISVSVSPALLRDHQLVLTIDGIVHSRGNSTQFTIDKIGRGAHSVQASIVDHSGQTLITSPSNSFFAYWPGGR